MSGAPFTNDIDRAFWAWMVLPLRRYAQFGGREGRNKYWWFSIPGVVATIIARSIDKTFFADPEAGPIGMVVAFGLAIPSLAVAIRRLHDIGRSGWWEGGIMVIGILGLALNSFGTGFNLPVSTPTTLLAIAWVGCAVMMAVWLFTPGTAGRNRFGPDPKTALATSP